MHLISTQLLQSIIDYLDAQPSTPTATAIRAELEHVRESEVIVGTIGDDEGEPQEDQQ